MKSLKKTLVLLVVLSMLVSAISPVFATNFNDEIDAAYWEHANKLAAVGVIKGDTNGNFNATSNITRAEMAVIICKMAGMNEALANANKNVASVFTDVPAGEWYTGWINLAVSNGMIAGFPDGTFRPNDPLTTNQAITLVVKALGKGAYVDKMGTWPGNYAQEAAKLGLTADMVDTGSDLANRGNVAVLAWEALQVGTWDVVSTTLDGEVTLSEADSLLVKYFPNFIAGKGTEKDPSRVKLVEDVLVTKTGKTDSELGANQIVIEIVDGVTKFDGERTTGYTLPEYIDAQDQPKKAYKTATYADTTKTVVAYVPAEVASVDSLVNKKVDILFGYDNEVVLLYVTEDTVDEAYVTAWDADEKEIEIAGETYKVNENAKVLMFNYDVESEDAIETISDLFAELEIEKPTKTFNRTVKADIVLDAKDRIEKINFTFSANGFVVTEDVAVEEGVVKSVSSAGVVKKLAGGSFFNGAEIEDLEDAELTRVIKDDVVAELADIEEGDVVTVIYKEEVPVLVYVSSAKVAGEVSKVKDFIMTVNDEAYNSIEIPFIEANGEFDEAAKVANRDEINEFIGEEVELYLNFMGEVVAVIADTSVEGTTLGIVVNDATLKIDDEDVEYMSVRILTADGGKATYKIYNSKSNKDISEATENGGFAWVDDGLTKGDVVIFSADSNRKIESDEIEFPVDEEYDFASNSDVKWVKIDAESDFVAADYDKKTITYDLNGAEANGEIIFKYNASTEAFNTHVGTGAQDPDKLEKVTGWDAIINDVENEGLAAMEDIYVFYKGTKVVYFVADFTDGYRTSNEKYAVVTDISYVVDSDGDKVYEITLFADGEEVTYELDAALRNNVDEGDFVVYTVSDDVVEGTLSTLVNRDAFVKAKEYGSVAAPIVVGLNNVVKAQTEVDSISDGWLYFVEKVDNPEYEGMSEAERDELDAAVAEAEEAKTTAETTLAEAEEALEATDEYAAVADAEADVAAKTTAKTDAEADVAAKTTAKTAAEADVAAKTTAKTAAEEALTNSGLTSGDDGYDELAQAVTDATADLTAAQTTLANATTALTDATTALTNATTALETAESTLEAAETDLEATEEATAVTEAEEALATAEEALEDAETALADAIAADEAAEFLTRLEEVELSEDGYIIYDLRGEEPTMIGDINDIVGEYVATFDTETEDGIEVIVVLK